MRSHHWKHARIALKRAVSAAGALRSLVFAACAALVLMLVAIMASLTLQLPTQSRHDAVALAEPAAPTQAISVFTQTPPQATACEKNGSTTFGSDVTVLQGESVCGSMMVMGGSASIQGQLDGNLTVVGGNARVSGLVTGNITVMGGNLELLSGADVYGDVRVLGGKTTREAGAMLSSQAAENSSVPFWPHPRWLMPGETTGNLWLRLVFWVLAAGLSARFFPHALTRVRDVARHAWPVAFVSGIIVALLAVIAGLVLFISCLGIPLAILVALAMWVAWLFGTVAVIAWVGGLVGSLAGIRARSLFWPTVISAAIFAVLQSVPVLGGLLLFFTAATGTGAVALALATRHRRRSWQRG